MGAGGIFVVALFVYLCALACASLRARGAHKTLWLGESSQADGGRADVLRTGSARGKAPREKPAASERVSAIYAQARSAQSVALNYPKRVSQKRATA